MTYYLEASAQLAPQNLSPKRKHQGGDLMGYNIWQTEADFKITAERQHWRMRFRDEMCHDNVDLHTRSCQE